MEEEDAAAAELRLSSGMEEERRIGKERTGGEERREKGA